MTTRRNFIKKAALGTAAISFGGIIPGMSAKSYANVIGANDKIRVGAIGVNSRGTAVSTNFAKQKGCEVIYICDVDSRAIGKCINSIDQAVGYKPEGIKDLRKMVEKKDVDAVIIATPDHWHAPAALLAMQAGKNIYLEKPCSYAPAEGELLMQAAKKYNRVLQMGNQRRSWPNVCEGIQALKEGIIGKVYFGKSWYTNNRKPIGIGKEVPVPEWLDWELWQGPAPRVAYKDNIIHYNWHWFWHWGTGEALNNGTHMIDILRWGMEVDYPTMVNSAGGRYFAEDDWETPDTQIINIEFGNKFSMSWEGRSCNGRTIEGSSVGSMFYGEKGSLLITGSDGYKIFGLDNKLIKEQNSKIPIDPRNLMNPAEKLDAFHIQNFFDAIREGEKLHSDIESGHKSTLLMQLGNIAQRVGRSLRIDPTNGHILSDPEAMKLWSRDYEPGWEMII
ncbi:Gfo/Idh/MocA family protein [Parabacteroides sp. Marseille-P3160]|uniref:Gfo/Idh/MocA family protein n=1 Tax=Parabacteroides sp. Marseille-P3160 TaxID=1917887 RepID=UPI0009BA6787|nr:Gfo/Idh/MocA family oxidoreductase [Parabacteroides sp. Marseille-P3160]